LEDFAMSASTVRWSVFGVCLASLAAPSERASAQGCSTVRASVGPNGEQGTAHVGQIDIAGDGRYVLFTTTSSNIVPTNGFSQVVRHHLATGATLLISATSAGTPANSVCENPRTSSDARWTAFSSRATNLVTGTPFGHSNIFLHDAVTGTNYAASRSTSGEFGNSDSFDPAISSDGRYVVFTGAASNLDPIDTNGVGDVFLFDRDAGTTELVSLTATGTLGDLYSVHPSISADGRYVAFESMATTFVPTDVNGVPDVFVKDRVTAALILVSARPDGIPGNGSSYHPSISGDGRFVAFESNASDLGPPGTGNGGTHAFVRDLATNTTTVVSLTLLGAPSLYMADNPRISYDGRFVVFESLAPDLVIGDTNASSDVFLFDRARQQTFRESLSNAFHQTSGYSGSPVVSDDGTRVAFISFGTDLVDGDTNGFIDAFVRICELPSGTPFCAGDGTATPCPCGNSGVPGSGCATATEPDGGHLFALGTPSVSSDTFVLRGEGLPASYIVYFQGTIQANGGAGNVFGDGLLCAGGSIVRLGTKLSTGNVSGYPDDGELPISVKGSIPPGGGTRTYQGWFRASADFCTPATFNMTNGIQAVWQP
jgi:Tol biopolymer transport system component